MVTRPKLRLSRYLVPVIIVLAIIFSIRQCGNQEKPSGHPRDYAAIAKEGILRVATEYNSISFYVDGDTVSGFHYELIQAFAHDKGLKTESLRDNMTNLELVLNMLAEATTTEISKERKPRTTAANRAVAAQGGRIAGNTRREIEAQTGKRIVSPLTAKQALAEKTAEGIEHPEADTTE